MKSTTNGGKVEGGSSGQNFRLPDFISTVDPFVRRFVYTSHC